MSEFTKGDWAVNKHYGCIHSGETLIARIANFSETASTPETEANARLIAAAPELLSLSRRLLFYAYKQCNAVEEPYRYEIKAIINEAEELFARILEEERR